MGNPNVEGMDNPCRLAEAIQYFAMPENCRDLLISVRWKDGPVRCPHCGSARVNYLAKSRLWKCHSSHPKQKFSPKTGTVFEHSILGLDKILVAIWMVANCKGRLSSYALASVLQSLRSQRGGSSIVFRPRYGRLRHLRGRRRDEKSLLLGRAQGLPVGLEHCAVRRNGLFLE